MSEKYSKSSRISGAKRYNAIFNEAARIRGKYITLLYRANDLGHARLGFAVSNKHAGSVVRKNKIKRQIREFFRKQLTDRKYDMVMISKPAISLAGSEEIDNNLQFIRRKLNRQHDSL